VLPKIPISRWDYLVFVVALLALGALMVLLARIVRRLRHKPTHELTDTHGPDSRPPWELFQISDLFRRQRPRH
jgi:hypothetical protein